MKNSAKISTMLTFVVLAFCLSSCKKNDSNGSDANLKQQISLLADGIAYSVTTGDAGVLEAHAYIRDVSNLQLDAEKGDKDFSISFDNITGIGTYTINKNNYSVFTYAQWEDGSDIFSSSGGTNKSRLTFNITNIAGNTSDYKRYIEGNFSGVLYNFNQTDSVVITDGLFDIIE